MAKKKPRTGRGALEVEGFNAKSLRDNSIRAPNGVSFRAGDLGQANYYSLRISSISPFFVTAWRRSFAKSLIF
jgi:hypothetical protein